MNKVFRVRFLVFAAGLAASILCAGCSNQAAPDPPAPDSEYYLKKAKEFYEKAKETGEKAPGEMVDFLKEDLKRIGSWEYKVETVQVESADQLETRLNELGQERWDCFWIDKSGGELVLLLKRPSRSYLKAVPAIDLWKLIPVGGGNEQ